MAAPKSSPIPAYVSPASSFQHPALHSYAPLQMSGVRCAADISKIVLDGPARIAELVELSEAYFERRLSGV